MTLIIFDRLGKVFFARGNFARCTSIELYHKFVLQPCLTNNTNKPKPWSLSFPSWLLPWQLSAWSTRLKPVRFLCVTAGPVRNSTRQVYFTCTIRAAAVCSRFRVILVSWSLTPFRPLVYHGTCRGLLCESHFKQGNFVDWYSMQWSGAIFHPRRFGCSYGGRSTP